MTPLVLSGFLVKVRGVDEYVNAGRAAFLQEDGLYSSLWREGNDGQVLQMEDLTLILNVWTLSMKLSTRQA